MPFPRVLSPKVNVIARLEFELAYNDVAVLSSTLTTIPQGPPPIFVFKIVF